MNIALIGYGKMGKEVEAVAKERGVRIVMIFTRENNLDGAGLTKSALTNVDVCIDFSTPEAALRNIEAVVACGKNMVVGTTGWHNNLQRARELVRKHKTGLVYASNFSLGVNIFSRMVAEAARLIEPYAEYDVAISETHHAGKADSPSGTALSLASLIMQSLRRKSELMTEPAKGRIKPHQLHIASQRLGHTTGRHCVAFDSDADTIELVHTAKNRRGFAAGALVAAQWIKGKKGFYTMHDVIAH
jgi:4-hydroxy-tetrahydrodipicolinate reductase